MWWWAPVCCGMSVHCVLDYLLLGSWGVLSSSQTLALVGGALDGGSRASPRLVRLSQSTHLRALGVQRVLPLHGCALHEPGPRGEPVCERVAQSGRLAEEALHEKNVSLAFYLNGKLHNNSSYRHLPRPPRGAPSAPRAASPPAPRAPSRTPSTAG